jgi:hypothetical protein
MEPQRFIVAFPRKGHFVRRKENNPKEMHFPENFASTLRPFTLVLFFSNFTLLARVRFPALTEKKVVGLERDPLSLVSTTEELLDRKIAAPV